MEKDFFENMSPNSQDWLNSLTHEECNELQLWLQGRIKYLNNIPLIKKKIDDLNLSARAYNALKSNNLFIVQDIVHFGIENIWKIRNIGTKTAAEIQQAINL